MSTPILPIDHRGLTREQTADLLRGLSDFIETYPHDAFVVTIDITPAVTEGPAAKTRRAPRKKV